jgi:FKBP-type peptidyl-prolyl cis-trans isomerase 2
MKSRLAGFILMGTVLGWTALSGAQEIVADGKEVSFHYTLTVDGKEVESSQGREPLTYVQGQGQIIPGLESGVMGLKPGDTKTVEVSPENAYGDILEEGFVEVPKTAFPEDFTFVNGQIVEMQSADGIPVPAIIWEELEETVKLNFNHPLAGKTLTFDVEIISVNEAGDLPVEPHEDMSAE